MNKPPISSLDERLRTRIRREGPITFYEWMQSALYDPTDGYYFRPDRLRQGRAGDYRTAPESSPLFAATFARYFAKLFHELGSPRQWTICEVGAGRGDFAFGILNSLQRCYPNVFHATTYSIDEVSNDARSKAFARLSQFSEKIMWQSLDEIKDLLDPGIIFSNELIDAFPIHRVTFRKGKLRELCVGLRNDEFVWVDCDPDASVSNYCRRSKITLNEDQIVEINLSAEDFISRAGSSLKQGFVITVDYGAERDELLSASHRREGTLRAFQRHELIDDVLSHPGEQDLTTTIDWTQISEAGESVGLETVRHERLDQFLLHEGLLEELQMLTSELPESEALRLRTSAREMIMPTGLAASFQVLIQRKAA